MHYIKRLIVLVCTMLSMLLVLNALPITQNYNRECAEDPDCVAFTAYNQFINEKKNAPPVVINSDNCGSNPECVGILSVKEVIKEEMQEFPVECVHEAENVQSTSPIVDFCKFKTCLDFFVEPYSVDWKDKFYRRFKTCSEIKIKS